MTKQNLRIQLRRDSATNWETADPTLFEGEVGLELDTGRSKTGDGSTPWTLLPYSSAGLVSVGKGLTLPTERTTPGYGEAVVNMGDFNTGDLVEGSNLYYTSERVTGELSITPSPAVKNGSLSYTQSTGSFAYAPCDAYTEAEVDNVINPLADRVSIIEGNVIGDGSKADLVNGRVPVSQIPNLAVVDFLGTVADEAAMLASGANTIGDFVIRDDKGTTYVLVELPSTDVANWRELQAAGAAVLDVNGQSGPTVSLTAIDLPDVYSNVQVDAALEENKADSTLLTNTLVGVERTARELKDTAHDVSIQGLENNKANLSGANFTGDVTIDTELSVGGDIIVGGDLQGDVIGDTTGIHKGNVISDDGLVVVVNTSTLSYKGKIVASDDTEVLNPRDGVSPATYVGDSTGVHSGAVTLNVDSTLTNCNLTNTGGSFVGNLVGGLFGDVVASDNSTVVLTPGNGSTVIAEFTGDVTGNVTGDLTGDVTGNLTGDVTGNLTGDVTGDVIGNLTGDSTGAHYGDLYNTGGTQKVYDQTTGLITAVKVEAAVVGQHYGPVAQIDSYGSNPPVMVLNPGTVGQIATFTGDVYQDGGFIKMLDSSAGTFAGNLTGDVTGNVTGDLTGSVDATGGTVLVPHNTIPNAGGSNANAADMENIYDAVATANGYTDATVGALTTDDIDDSTSTNKYATDANIRAAVSAGGDLSYDVNSGEFSFTERTDAQVTTLAQGAISLSTSAASGQGSLTYTAGAFAFAPADVYTKAEAATKAQGDIADAAGAVTGVLKSDGSATFSVATAADVGAESADVNIVKKTSGAISDSTVSAGASVDETISVLNKLIGELKGKLNV